MGDSDRREQKWKGRITGKEMVYFTDTEKTDIFPLSAANYDWTSKILFWALICWSLCLKVFVSRYMKNRTDVNTLNLLFVSGLG